MAPNSVGTKECWHQGVLALRYEACRWLRRVSEPGLGEYSSRPVDEALTRQDEHDATAESQSNGTGGKAQSNKAGDDEDKVPTLLSANTP